MNAAVAHAPRDRIRLIGPLVIVLKDLYELLEKIIDRCRDSGNVIAHIALKNS